MQDIQPLPLAEGEDPSLLTAASGQTDDGENTSIDADYRRRLQKAEDDDALDFMARMKGQLGLVPQPSEGQEQKPGAPVPSGQPGAPAPEQSSAMGEPWSMDRAKYMLGMGGSVAGDIAGGVAKAPRAIYSGGVKAWDALAGLGDAIIPMGTLQITDPKTGALSPGLVDTKEFEAAGGSEILRGSVPDPVAPETVTEGLIGGMSQFLAGFGLAGKAFSAAGYGAQGGNVAQLARSILQGGASSFAVFDGQEERLSNLIQQYPDIANPVTEFLAADEEDPELVGRLKNVVENAIPDVGFAGVLQGLRVMKAARRVKELTGAQTYQEMAEKLAANVEAGEVRPEPQPQAGVFDDLLGPEQGNVVERPAPAANPMFKEQEFGVPDDVVARGVVGAANDASAQPASSGAEAARSHLAAGGRADASVPASASQAVPQAEGSVAGGGDVAPVRETRGHRSILFREGEGALRAQLATETDEELLDRAVRTGINQPDRDRSDLIEDLVADAKQIQAERMAFAGGSQGVAFDGLPEPGIRKAEQRSASPATIRGYHGTPYEVDRFDLSKVGTGEGTRVAGHGIYIAETERNAARYRDYFGPVLIDGQRFDDYEHITAAKLKREGELDRAIAEERSGVELLRRNPNLDDDMRAILERKAQRLEAMERVQRADVQSAGNLYEVEIAAKPEQMLDWDAPVNAQPIANQAREAARRVGIADDRVEALLSQKGADFYGQLEQMLGNDEAASAALRDAGVPGIRYKNMETEGEVDYVVFDPNSVTIKTKNGKPITGAEKAAIVDEMMGGGDAAAKGADPNAIPGTAAPASPAAGGASKIDSPSGELYINWSRIDSSDSVKAVIRDMAEAFRPEIEESTRGVRSNATTRDAAGKIDAFKTLMGERKIPLPSAEEQLALRQMWSAAGTKTLEIARLANENPSPENLFALRKMLSIHAAVQREVIGIRTETARALQQWSIPADAGEMRLRSLQQQLDANGGMDVNADLAAKIASLQGQEGAEGALNLMARKSAAATTLDAVRELWVNALLSGPKTHVVNAISNSGVVFHAMLERAVSARIADLTGSIDGVRIGEAAAMWYGVKQALPDAWRLFKRSLRTSETGGALGKTELPRRRAISQEALGATTNETFNAAMNRPMMGAFVDALGGMVNIPGRALGAADEFFKAVNHRAELWAVAFRNASEEAERGIIKSDQIKARMAETINNPPDDVKIKAEDFAEYNTFTNDPGDFTKSIMRLRETWPALHFILPFVQTPSNILRYTLERTPMAPITQKFRTDFAAGGVRRQLALAKMGIGSGVMLAAYDMALNGNITGGGPSDRREKATLLRTGWQPYSVKVGNRYFAYNRLDPVGFYVGMAADIAEYATNTDTRVDADFEEVFATAVFSAAENFMNKTYLRGFSDFMGAALNADSSATTERYLVNLATSFIPTGVAEVSRQMTPQQKYTHDFISRAKSRLPGLAKDVPNRLDFWGREISYQSGLGKLYDATSPIYSREEKPEPIDQEFKRLGYHPDSHDLYVRVSGQNVSIRNRPEIVHTYHKAIGATPASDLPRDLANRKAGTEGLTRTVIKRLNSYGDKTMLETMNELIEQPSYQDADDEEKESQIKEVISAYRAGARLKVIQEYPVLQELRSKMDD